MRIDIISPLPKLLHAPFSTSILARAIDKKIVEIHIHDLRDYSQNKHKKIDDYSYGGGGGMVLMIEPIANCIQKLQNERTYDSVIFMTPDGEKLTQKTANSISQQKNIIILCGRYEGVDQRVRDLFINREISIGDYVIMGGELPTLVLCESVIRLLPGSMSNSTCALHDSFQDNLLSHPVYTRPANFQGSTVPDILLSGNDNAISKWREEQSYQKTKNIRPDLIQKSK